MRFAAHETFHPRFGWLKKGYDHVQRDPAIFHNKEQAHIDLGVGKNMANAVRYWLLAFGIVSEVENHRGYEPTEFGDLIFGENGFDTYLEDPATLWLLHYKLVTNEELATAWYFIFNSFAFRKFTIDDISHELQHFVALVAPTKSIAPSSLEKDISCILRMYVSNIDNSKIAEDSLDSPFTVLDLIHKYEGMKQYSFHVGEKNNLPPEIIVALCLYYVTSQELEAKTISLSKLANEKKSPGMVCKIGEKEIEEAIEKTIMKNNSLNSSIGISNQAGVAHLSINSDAKTLWYEILNQYYEKSSVLV